MSTWLRLEALLVIDEVSELPRDVRRLGPLSRSELFDTTRFNGRSRGDSRAHANGSASNAPTAASPASRFFALPFLMDLRMSDVTRGAPLYFLASLSASFVQKSRVSSSAAFHAREIWSLSCCVVCVSRSDGAIRTYHVHTSISAQKLTTSLTS